MPAQRNARWGSRSGPACEYNPLAAKQLDQCGVLLDYFSKKGVAYISAAKTGNPYSDAWYSFVFVAMALVVTVTPLEDAEERLAEAHVSPDQALSVDETAVKGMDAALPRAIGKFRKALDRIEDTLSTRPEHSRELLRDLLEEPATMP